MRTTATGRPPTTKRWAVFGAMSFWWMGEHGTPRIDTSEHVWFANDQLAVRFIEEIDFDYCAADATAVSASPATRLDATKRVM